MIDDGRAGAPLRVALVGFGLAGTAFHAPLIATTPGLRLALVVTGDAERAARARADYPGAEVVASADDVWARADEVDAVVLATPNRTHAPLAERGIDAGLAVVIDKPMATTATDARRLVERARERGVLLTVYQNRRWDGDLRTLRRLLDEGRLGAPLRFESRFERWRPVPKAGWRERGGPEEAGGVLYDLGSHLVDQALLLFGPARDVYAELDLRRPGVRVVDDAFVAITHRSGVRSHLWMSALAAHEGPRLRALGTAGAYVKEGMDVQEAALRAGARPGPGWGEEPRAAWGQLVAGDARETVPTERGDYPAFYAELARALRGEAPPPVDAADAVAGLEVIEAAQRSAAERRVVALD